MALSQSGCVDLSLPHTNTITLYRCFCGRYTIIRFTTSNAGRIWKAQRATSFPSAPRSRKLMEYCRRREQERRYHGPRGSGEGSGLPTSSSNSSHRYFLTSSEISPMLVTCSGAISTLVEKSTSSPLRLSAMSAK